MLMQNTTTHSLREVFAGALCLPADTDWSAVQYGLTAGWDSLAHMQLIAQMESHFDVMLATDQVIDLSSFKKAQEILEAHGIHFEP